MEWINSCMWSIRIRRIAAFNSTVISFHLCHTNDFSLQFHFEYLLRFNRMNSVDIDRTPSYALGGCVCRCCCFCCCCWVLCQLVRLSYTYRHQSKAYTLNRFMFYGWNVSSYPTTGNNGFVDLMMLNAFHTYTTVSTQTYSRHILYFFCIL